MIRHTKVQWNESIQEVIFMEGAKKMWPYFTQNLKNSFFFFTHFSPKNSHYPNGKKNVPPKKYLYIMAVVLFK